MKKMDFKDMNQEEIEHVTRLVQKYAMQFQLPEKELSATSFVQHRFITKDEVPINVKQYRPPHQLQEVIEEHVLKDLKTGIIRHSKSPYNSPTWLVKKKSKPGYTEEKWRMVIDFKKLNDKTIDDAFPLPNITDILDQLGGAKYFTTIDLASGYHQIKLDPRDAEKTAFSMPNGHYEYIRMPMGLKLSVPH